MTQPLTFEAWKDEMIRYFGISTWEHQYEGRFLPIVNTSNSFES